MTLTKFCFFIDGLDEYVGDHQEILALLQRLSSSPCIKICTSSRPWVVFNRYYGNNSGQKLSLEYLNQSDIELFAKENLLEGAQCDQAEMDVGYGQLIQDIVDRSSGVFLWVYLVIKSLRRGLVCLDTTSELRARLMELPTQLEELFRKILDHGEPVYREQASRLYLIQLSGHESGLMAADVAHFDESDPNLALRDDLVNRRITQYESNYDPTGPTQTRVLTRCQDLLEFD